MLSESCPVPETRVPTGIGVWDDGAHERCNSPSERRVSARIGAISESATLAVDAKAKALKAMRPSGDRLRSPASPTSRPPATSSTPRSRPAATRSTTATPPCGGLPELKAAIAEKTLRDSGYEVDASQILVTNGGKQAIYEAFAAILDPGDEVVVPAPYWTTYPESIRLAGGVPVEVVADETTGYRVSVEQLEAARTERTKVVLFVSPSNPTGAVYSEADARAIGEWAVEHGLWVLTDEIYEHLVYGTAKFTSLPTLVPALRDKCIVVNGVAKTYAMTGWRVGWLIAPKDVVKAATNLQSHATSNVSNVAQVAALAAVSGNLDAVAEMRTAFDRRRQTIVRMLNEIDGVLCPEPEGAFYAYPSVKALLGKEIRGKRPATSVELAALILDEAEVAVVPGEAFGTPGYLRLSYALGDEDLVEGVSRLQKLLGEAKD